MDGPAAGPAAASVPLDDGARTQVAGGVLPCAPVALRVDRAGVKAGTWTIGAT